MLIGAGAMVMGCYYRCWRGGVEIISNVCAFYICTCFFFVSVVFFVVVVHFMLLLKKTTKSHIHEHNINDIVLQNLKNKIVNLCLL